MTRDEAIAEALQKAARSAVAGIPHPLLYEKHELCEIVLGIPANWPGGREIRETDFSNPMLGRAWALAQTGIHFSLLDPELRERINLGPIATTPPKPEAPREVFEALLAELEDVSISEFSVPAKARAKERAKWLARYDAAHHPASGPAGRPCDQPGCAGNLHVQARLGDIREWVCDRCGALRTEWPTSKPGP